MTRDVRPACANGCGRPAARNPRAEFCGPGCQKKRWRTSNRLRVAAIATSAQYPLIAPEKNLLPDDEYVIGTRAFGVLTWVWAGLCWEEDDRRYRAMGYRKFSLPNPSGHDNVAEQRAKIDDDAFASYDERIASLERLEGRLYAIAGGREGDEDEAGDVDVNLTEENLAKIGFSVDDRDSEVA